MLKLHQLFKKFLFSFCLLSYPNLVLNAPWSKSTGRMLNVGHGEGRYDFAATTPLTFLEIIGKLVSIFLGFLGTIFIILTIYAGFIYMTAQGSEEKTKKAIDTLRTALIGLAIVVGSYGIYAAISAIL